MYVSVCLSPVDKATNPLNKELDWESVRAFCEQLNKDLEGPQLATRLLAHKIQSPQEWEAMQALTVLETCMKNCGKRFHSEVGKFRFLNELIKVVSPKYLGSRAPEKVKGKVLELMYSWTVGLPDEVKIADAYQMLKKQEDLRAANKLIKEMVQEDQKRMDRVSRRVSALEEVNNNVRLLTELLGDYSPAPSQPNPNEELIRELYQRCEKMRPTLFRLASDTEDNDEALAEILQANDSLTQVINLYRQLVQGEELNGDGAAPRIPGSSSALLDLTGLDAALTTPSYPAFPTLSAGQTAPPPEAGLSLLDDELMSLGLNDPTSSSTSVSQTVDSTGWNSFQVRDGQSSDSVDAPIPAAPAAMLKPAVTAPSQAPPPAQPTPPGNKALEMLEELGKSLLQQSLPPEALQVKWDKQQAQPKPTLRDLQHMSGPAHSPAPIPAFSAEQPGAFLNSQPSLGTLSVGSAQPATPASGAQAEISLANVTVPLESIKPSSVLPVTVYDRHSLRVLFHFARDPPPARPDVLVVVISMLSSAPAPLRNIVFQSAVPKVMKVKLQPPSGTELPAFNPVLPPAAITQVLLLANPHREKVRLRYKLSFTLGDETFSEIGDVEQFPPPETWGSL
ncbi:GGA1 protein, partial [Amia calva]|nr:GGA1 protein [Amia calva]